MRVLTTLRLSTVLAALTVLVAIPATAFAYAPTGDDFITCVAGDDTNVVCVAGVFEVGCPADIAVTDESDATIDTATGTADDEGEVDFDFDVPADQADGDLAVQIECGGKVLADVIANVEDGEVIANAGFDSATMVGIAALAIALGAGALAFNRRRGSTDA